VAVVSVILDHHDSVQRGKGRLPWLAQDERGFRSGDLSTGGTPRPR